MIKICFQLSMILEISTIMIGIICEFQLDWSKKIKSFAHGEFNTANFSNKENIEEKIKMGKDIFDRNISYKKVDPVTTLS